MEPPFESKRSYSVIRSCSCDSNKFDFSMHLHPQIQGAMNCPLYRLLPPWLLPPQVDKSHSTDDGDHGYNKQRRNIQIHAPDYHGLGAGLCS